MGAKSEHMSLAVFSEPHALQPPGIAPSRWVPGLADQEHTGCSAPMGQTSGSSISLELFKPHLPRWITPCLGGNAGMAPFGTGWVISWCLPCLPWGGYPGQAAFLEPLLEISQCQRAALPPAPQTRASATTMLPWTPLRTPAGQESRGPVTSRWSQAGHGTSAGHRSSSFLCWR